MATVFCINTRQKFETNGSETLLDVLIREGVPIVSDCGGQKTCGKCAVKVLNCDCPPTPEDLEFLGEAKVAEGHRLSCSLTVRDGLAFEITDAIHHDLIEAPLSDWEGPELTCRAPSKKEKDIGLAVDVGTQNVKISFVELATGKELKRIYVRNRQMTIGSDIVSRMNFVLGNEGNARLMQKIIVDTLEEAIDVSGFPQERIGRIAVAGNSVMAHLFLRESVETLAKQPFQPAYAGEVMRPSAEFGFESGIDCDVISLPLIGSFVGGDITADLVYTDILRKPGNHILIDLGTNGEIVVKKGDLAFSTSTAAGPAFEGATIKHGMLAVPGAINSFKIVNGKVLYETIGHAPVKGICGSGLVDVIAELLDNGMIDASGRMVSSENVAEQFRSHIHEKAFHIGGGVFLTQQDIREVQLAKGAISAGLSRILEISNTKLEDYDALYLLGNFGRSISVKNAKRIGLLPDMPDGKIQVLGDVAVEGVRMVLLSDEWRKEASRLAVNVKNVNISDSATFQDLFVDAMIF